MSPKIGPPAGEYSFQTQACKEYLVLEPYQYLINLKTQSLIYYMYMHKHT